MLYIRFDNHRFTSLQALTSYISFNYGSLRGVPDHHPDIAVVNALGSVNIDYFDIITPTMPYNKAEDGILINKPEGDRNTVEFWEDFRTWD